jgi:hypothetical protein
LEILGAADNWVMQRGAHNANDQAEEHQNVQQQVHQPRELTGQRVDFGRQHGGRPPHAPVEACDDAHP